MPRARRPRTSEMRYRSVGQFSLLYTFILHVSFRFVQFVDLMGFVPSAKEFPWVFRRHPEQPSARLRRLALSSARVWKRVRFVKSSRNSRTTSAHTAANTCHNHFPLRHFSLHVRTTTTIRLFAFLPCHPLPSPTTHNLQRQLPACCTCFIPPPPHSMPPALLPPYQTLSLAREHTHPPIMK